MADMVNLLIAKHPRHLVCSALPPRKQFPPSNNILTDLTSTYHQSSMNDHQQEVQFDPTAYPRLPCTCIHPLHTPSLDDPLADRQSQSQPQNPNPTPPPTIRMEAHIRLCDADQLPVRLIPLRTDYRNLLLCDTKMHCHNPC